MAAKDFVIIKGALRRCLYPENELYPWDKVEVRIGAHRCDVHFGDLLRWMKLREEEAVSFTTDNT